MNQYKDLFKESHCLSKQQLLGYIHQTLERDEIYAIENHLADCDFCSDALDGLMQHPQENIHVILKDIKSTFEEKLSQHPNLSISDPLQNPAPKLKSHVSRNRWMIAASLLLLIGLGGYSVYSFMHSSSQNLAKKEKGTESAAPSNYSETDQQSPELRGIEVEEVSELTKSSKTTSTEKDESNNEPKVAKSMDPLPSSTRLKDGQENIQPKEKVQASAPDIALAKESKSDRPILVEHVVKDNANEGSYQIAESELKAPKVEQAPIPQKKSTVGMQNKRGESNNSNAYNNNNDVVNTTPMQSNQMSYSSDKLNEENVKMIKQTTKESNLKEAINLFNKGRYKKSIKLLEKQLQENNSNAEKEDIYYYLALSHERLGDSVQADKYYTLLASSGKYKTMVSERNKTVESIKKKK